MKKKYLEKFQQKLKDVFSDIPALSVRQIFEGLKISPSDKADLVFELIYNNKQIRIIVEIISNGEPRYVRSVAHKISSYLTDKSDIYGIIAAPDISQRSGEICRESALGYIDLSGNCFISFNTIYIKRENYKRSIFEKKETKSLFAKKTSRLLRALLNNPDKVWTQLELSKETDVSIGLTNRVMKKLFNQEYISFEKNKRIILKNPSELLESWREEYSFSDNILIGYYSPLSMEEFENRLSEYMDSRERERYALTLFSGASLVAPFVRSNQVFFYFSSEREVLIEEIELKPVSTGANVMLFVPYDEGIFYSTQIIENKCVVSNIQLYLDLFNYKGRGKEQAEYLREKVIGF